MDERPQTSRESHHTRSPAPRGERATPQPRLNIRLWGLVGVLILLLPLVVVGIRGAAGPSVAAPVVTPSGPQDGDTGPGSTDTSDGPEATPTSPTSSRSPTPASSKSASRPPEKKSSVPQTGPGKYVTATRTAAPTSGKGRQVRYRVRVEKNLGLDVNAVAATVQKTLDDTRSWTGDGSVRFRLVGKGDADLTVYLTTPGTTDALCAPLRTFGEVSCQQGNRVVLNAERWILGVRYYGDDLVNYRRYLVNHEVGHYLGRGHVGCPAKGRKAPIMMQQTKGLGGCRANPWVKPSRK